MLRIFCVIGLAVVVALAFFSRGHPVGIYVWDKSLGDALSALAVYMGLVALRPGWRPLTVTCTSAIFCAAIESFKLTGLPAAWRAHAFSRLTLGTTPSVHNLVCYGIAVFVASLAHVALLRPAKKVRSRDA